mmetsp:Transcript_125801/g.402704  ORF Transcript_125801/g.402704 Transcript_125801/m.402704 type:complete len:319 (-) Transcript_125801:171-1127(-)
MALIRQSQRARSSKLREVRRSCCDSAPGSSKSNEHSTCASAPSRQTASPPPAAASSASASRSNGHQPRDWRCGKTGGCMLRAFRRALHASQCLASGPFFQEQSSHLQHLTPGGARSSGRWCAEKRKALTRPTSKPATSAQRSSSGAQRSSAREGTQRIRRGAAVGAVPLAEGALLEMASWAALKVDTSRSPNKSSDRRSHTSTSPSRCSRGGDPEPEEGVRPNSKASCGKANSVSIWPCDGITSTRLPMTPRQSPAKARLGSTTAAEARPPVLPPSSSSSSGSSSSLQADAAAHDPAPSTTADMFPGLSAATADRADR